MERIIIIGAGIGGVQTATTLATLGIESTLITNEEYPPYYRMRLVEIVTEGEPRTIAIHPYSWYEEKKIRLIKGNVISIDRATHTISLDDGSIIPYTRLVIATGANALSFPIKGLGNKAFVLRKMDDALFLCEKLKRSKVGSLTIIGGGLLGLESAVSIAEHYKVHVNVIESQEYILSKQIDRSSASFINKELE